jgi:hypothetical protein
MDAARSRWGGGGGCGSMLEPGVPIGDACVGEACVYDNTLDVFCLSDLKA